MSLAAVEQFRTAAAQFRQAALTSPTDFEALAASMASLYAAACALPDLEAGEGDLDQAEPIPFQLDPLMDAAYRTHFDPWRDGPGDSVQASLSDDVADILRDLGEGEALFLSGMTDEAVWSWRFTFRTHWGRHLTSGLHAIHTWLVD